MTWVSAPGRLVFAVKIGLLAVTTAGATVVNAGSAPTAVAQQRAVQAYDIGAGSLVDVLTRFSSAAGVAISFDARQLEGLRSPGLKGSFGVGDGFARILGERSASCPPG